jgi:riboflavin transporter 2
VTFLPFIGKHYKKEYIIPTYVGESLSAMIPSMLGIIQGVGEDPGCQEKNVTNGSNTTVELEPLPLKPRFSVMIYFLILCFLLIISTSAFSILNFSKLSRKERKMSETKMTDTADEQFDNTPYSSTTNFSKSVNDSGQNIGFPSVRGEKPTQAVRSTLLVIIFWVSFIAYGLLPALQSYSTLPYGNSVFHLSINIGRP